MQYCDNIDNCAREISAAMTGVVQTRGMGRAEGSRAPERHAVPRLRREGWPMLELSAVPTSEQTAELAERVRRSLLGAHSWDMGPVDVDRTCGAGGFRLQERRLGGADGGLEALLLPRAGHFDLVVDPEPRGGWAGVTPTLRGDLARHRLRFRAAHEWAHSFFYTRGSDGIVRQVPDSPAQERFCDEFAAALLVPPSAAAKLDASAVSVEALQRRFDVSLELAARAVAGAHPRQAFWLLVVPEHAPAFVQWRSRASYGCGVVSREALAAADAFDGGSTKSRRGATSSRALAVHHLRARRQALVFCT